jgi:hypothetical protein
MGLDISHDCWHGSYTAFMNFRAYLYEAAGWGRADFYKAGLINPRAVLATLDRNDILYVLLAHSDCEGEIPWRECVALADRLEGLIPYFNQYGPGGGHLYRVVKDIEQFAAGLRLAAKNHENVEFT